MTYENIKQKHKENNTFLVDGVIFYDGENEKMNAFVTTDGALIPENLSLATQTFFNTENKNILLFKSQEKTSFCSLDHSTGIYRANVPGVVYPLAFKKFFSEFTNDIPYFNKIDDSVSDKELVERMNAFYIFALKASNHPKKNFKL